MTKAKAMYDKAQDTLLRAQERLRLSDALSVKSRFYSPSPIRTDYVRDLECEAFMLFEEATTLYKDADKLARTEGETNG